MKRFRVFSVMLVFLLALGMVFIACGDDSGSNSGGGGDPGNGGGDKVYPIDISEGNDWPPSSVFEKYNLGNLSKPSGLVVRKYYEYEGPTSFYVDIHFTTESASVSMFRSMLTGNGYVETHPYDGNLGGYFEKSTGGIIVNLNPFATRGYLGFTIRK